MPDEATMTNGCGPSSPIPKGPGFMDLPIETQNQIMTHVPIHQLLNLAIVSHHFNELANAQIYKQLFIMFDDSEFRDRDAYEDALAGSLDSMVTSKREYSKYLKDLRFDSPNSGKKGENDYKEFSYNVSCGKFMNTLLVLALGRATGLESFHWNIRVELSPPLLETLQKLPLLQHLHVRLPSGLPTWKAVRDPFSIIPFSTVPPPPLPPPQPSSSTQPGFGLPPPSGPSPSLLFPPPSPPVVILPAHGGSRPRTRRPSLKNPVATKRPTLGGFKNLSTLSVLDIDDLDYIDDVASTITASWQTLKTLKISFSEDLANKSRLPDVPNSDDSDQDVDELQGVHTPPTPEYTQEKEAAVRKQLQRQSSVLARLLGDPKSDSEDADVPPPKRRSTYMYSSSDSESALTERENNRNFVRQLQKMTEQLLKVTSGPVTTKEKLKHHKQMLALMTKAGNKYVKSKNRERRRTSRVRIVEYKKKPVPGPSKAFHKTKKSSTKDLLASPSDSEDSVLPPPPKLKKKKSIVVESKSEPKEKSALFDEPVKKGSSAKKGSDDADDNDLGINIDFPDVDVDGEDSGSEINEHTAEEIAGIEQAAQELKQSLEDALTGKRSDKAKDGKGSNTAASKTGPGDSEGKGKGKAKAESPNGTQVNGLEKKRSEQDAISHYVRTTRKLEQLENFALYLVPIKPAIIYKSIVLHKLKRITLLNVGIQDSFWSMMSKENRETPLALEAIFTDNVTKIFLNCVKGLRKVTELLMIEPSRKSTDSLPSLAPPTRVRIMDIRKLALVKHIRTLKRLMIANKAAPGYEWDLNAQTTKLIATWGSNLEELAVSFNMSNYHLLLQNFSNLTSLRAFHILQLDLRDACLSVQLEIRRSVLDSISYMPNTKLRYIAYDKSVDQVRHREADMRALTKLKGKGDKNSKDDDNKESTSEDVPAAGSQVAETDATNGKIDIKGKGKAKAVPPPSITDPSIPNLGSDSDSDLGNDSDTDSTTSTTSSDYSSIVEHQLKFDLRPAVFYQIGDVKIFRKDIRAGKL